MPVPPNFNLPVAAATLEVDAVVVPVINAAIVLIEGKSHTD